MMLVMVDLSPPYGLICCTWQCEIKNVANHRGGSQCFGPGPARPPNPSLLSTGPWAGPAPQALTFIDRAWASPAPQSLTFIDRNPSLLSTGPGQPGPPTPHFYWPDPSLLLARPITSILARPLNSIGHTPHFYWPEPSLLLAKTSWPDPSLLLALAPAMPRQVGQLDPRTEFSHHRSEGIFSPLGKLQVRADTAI